MTIIGEDKIINHVKEIASKLSIEDKEAIDELLFYYNVKKSDVEFLQNAVKTEREIHQKYFNSTIKHMSCI